MLFDNKMVKYLSVKYIYVDKKEIKNSSFYKKLFSILNILNAFISNEIFYKYCFPFGRPEGALKGTLSLLERVIALSISYFLIFK